MTPEALRGERIAEATRRYASDKRSVLEHLMDIYETNWTPPEPEVDPDLLAAREWAKTTDMGSPALYDDGSYDTEPEIIGFLAGCTRGREGTTGLVEALEELLTLCEAADEADDLPDTVTGDAMFKARQALASAKRGG